MNGQKRIFLAVALLLNALVPAAGTSAQTASKTYGDGVAAYSLQDFERAFAIWKPLAEAGDSESQYRLGMLYQEGRGTDANTAEAARWFRAAAEAGQGRAAYLLGNMYATGVGVSEDPAEAFRWFLRSANRGQARAQFHVAIEYLEDGVAEKSFLEAHIWFSRAAEGLPPGEGKRRAAEARDRTLAALSDAEKTEATRRLNEGLPRR